MTVRVYGKPGCGLCDAAKDKLVKMGIPFESCELAKVTDLHPGWRTDDSVAIMACYADINTMPVVTVDGDAMSYPEAMKLLKNCRKQQKQEAAVIPMPSPKEAEAVAV